MTLTRNLKNNFKILFLALGLAGLVAGGGVLLVQQPVQAQSQEVCKGIDKIQGANCGGNNQGRVNSIIKTVSNTLIFFVGAVSVIMVIFGGFKYVISAGDSQRVESAKNTVLYAIVGLAVSIMAFAIVNFVLNAL